jgi:site-specific DNA-adenine methylase
MDFVVKGVYSKVKSLENKYIDLANFYKEAAQQRGASYGGKTSDPTTENMMIRDLIENKRELEDHIGGLKNAISSSRRGASPSKQ